MVRVIVIAGTHSGVGKTTLSVGLMAALRARGLVVAPFKVGPDFLDGLHHSAATAGAPSINLDGFMLTDAQTRAAFARAARAADVAVVEGVMGLYDGRDGASDAGSTAQIAKWLGAPVALALDAGAMARSAAAVVKGFVEFDPLVAFAGVVFSRVGSPAHGAWLAEALAAADLGVASLGCLPSDSSIAIRERHLGLTTPAEQQQQRQGKQHEDKGQAVSNNNGDDDYIARLAAFVARHLDLDALLAAAADVTCTTLDAWAAAAAANAHAARPMAAPAPPRVRIGVARDEAFLFYYHDSLALLAAAGADLIPFSPLRDARLPPRLAGLYLGGGYPERFAARLAANAPMRAAVAAFSRAGGAVYAECGGLMYLAQFLDDGGGGRADDSSALAVGGEAEGLKAVKHEMAGVLPFGVQMAGPRGMKMGYVEVDVLAGCPLFPPAQAVRAQVFHFSEIVEEDDQCSSGSGKKSKISSIEMRRTYGVRLVAPGASPEAEGFAVNGRTLASHVHLHFGGCPQFAATLVEACREVDAAAVSQAAADAADAAEEATLAAGAAAAAAAAAAPSADANGAADCEFCSGAREDAGAAPAAPCTVASLVPSGTEIALALGLDLCAVSAFDDDDDSDGDRNDDGRTAHLPRATRAAVDTTNMSSAEVEAAMRALAAARRPAVEVNAALLARLKPSLLLAQETCAKCDATAAAACAAARAAGLSAGSCRVLSLSPRTLAEVGAAVRAVGAAAGAARRADAVAAELDARVAAARAASLAALAAAPDADAGGCLGRCATSRPKVAVLCGLEPLAAANLWVSDMIETAAAAADALGGRPGDPPRRVTWDELAAAAPDALIISPCSRSCGRAVPEACALAQRPGWWRLPAVVNGRVCLVDHRFYSRAGPRSAAAGAELTARLVWGAELAATAAARLLPKCPKGAALRLAPPVGIVDAAALCGDGRDPMPAEWWVPVE